MEDLSRDVVERPPDLARWVEVRGMLLSGRGRVLEARCGRDIAATVLQQDTGLGGVIGRCAAAAIRRVSREARELIAAPEDAAWVARALPRWSSEPALVHLLPDAASPPESLPGRVRLLRPGEPAALPGLPAPLREELTIESTAGSPIAAAFLEDRPVAFCCAGSVTESLWDVGIETLEPFRRQGHASRCFTWLMLHLGREGRRPVWGAMASNTASSALARKLGFNRVDTLHVLRPP